MCGICGEVRFDARFDVPGGVDAMLSQLLHRGPDGEWVKGDAKARFGMARLMIRGLTSGEQPMVDAASGVMVVCNGEIDNHEALRALLAARGRPVIEDTDVAVLPGLYLEFGMHFVEHLVGAFAIAVWDPRSETLLLTRDRAGERPLFYAAGPEGARFASQVSALVKAGYGLDREAPEAIARFLGLGYFSAPDSPIAGVMKVAPAETVLIGPNGCTQMSYWRLPARGPRPKGEDLIKAFDRCFHEAVRRQSEVDVPVGLFLSGGVDSSLIAAIARHVHPEKSLTAYGLRFGEASFDEGDYAVRVADAFDMAYVPVWVQPDALESMTRAVIRTSGEPLADPAWIPTALLSERAATDIRIALSGEGADELFGGYPTYFGATLAEKYRKLPGFIRRILRERVSRWPPSDKKVTLSFLLKRFVEGDELEGLARHLLWNASLSPTLLKELGVSFNPPAFDAVPSESLLDTIQRYDLERSLAEGLLTKADRASMHSALELRAPFLDVSVMEFAARLPSEARVRGFKTKVFLKQYARRYLPHDIVYRRKRGLSVPLAAWLRGPLKAWALAALSAPALGRIGVDQAAAHALLEAHARREADYARALWTLMVMSEWLAWLDEDESAQRPSLSR